MSSNAETYICAKSSCRHRYKKSEQAMVPAPTRTGPKTLPTWYGTCPKCGCRTFYIAKEKTATN